MRALLILSLRRLFVEEVTAVGKSADYDSLLAGTGTGQVPAAFIVIEVNLAHLTKQRCLSETSLLTIRL